MTSYVTPILERAQRRLAALVTLAAEALGDLHACIVPDQTRLIRESWGQLADAPEIQPDKLRTQIERVVWKLTCDDAPGAPRHQALIEFDGLTVAGFDAEIGDVLDRLGAEVAATVTELSDESA